MMKTIRNYGNDRHAWITCLEAEYYPDYLSETIGFFKPIIVRFGELLNSSSDSVALFRAINKEPKEFRTQLQRIFRKYISPNTSVEMLKLKTKEEEIIKNFKNQFRPIFEARKLFKQRPIPDEALVALLHEYRTRGQKGYELTTAFFAWFKHKFNNKFNIKGPERAGPDIPLRNIFKDYPRDTTVDFIVLQKQTPLIIGYARYDSDRGGAQGLDRINSYSDKVTEILDYAKTHKLPLKLLFINDGPGLLLGRLWDRYSSLEEKGNGRVIVATLKMLDGRVTEEWIMS